MANLLFMEFRESGDGVGGPVFSCAESYDVFMEELLDHYDQIYMHYADFIEDEDPDIDKYIQKLKKKSSYTKDDVNGFNLDIAGIQLCCCDLYSGKKGFLEFIEAIRESDWSGELDEKLDQLSKCYGSPSEIDSILCDINEKLWCD